MKVLVLLAACAALCAADPPFQGDKSVCTPPTNTNVPGAPSLPTLPDQFQTEVEGNFIDKSYSIEAWEYYDGKNNRGVLHLVQPLSGDKIDIDTIYDYDDEQAIIVARLPKVGGVDLGPLCTVQDIKTYSLNFVFGVDIGGQHAHIMSPAAVLRLDPKNMVYVGKDTVRGIAVNHWKGCLYWDNVKTTMSIHWYLSDPKMWTNPNSKDAVPVRAMVSGKVKVNSTLTRQFEHLYDFIHFKPGTVDEMAFEVPRGVSCPGRKGAKKLPALPNAFSFNAEIVMPSVNYVGYSREEYDFNSHVAKIVYTPMPTAGDTSAKEYGIRELVEVHDFNTGVAYIMDPMIGNCTVTPISALGFDAVQNAPGTVRIRNPKEFFYFDGTDFVYQGLKKVRDMDSYTFSGVRKNFAPLKPLNEDATLEWAFVTEDWMENADGTLEKMTPVRFDINSLTTKFTYNIFDFKTEKPDIFDYDIGQCYIFRDRRYFQFLLPGEFKDIVAVNMKEFKYSVLVSILGYTVISPLRVANLNLDFDDKNIIVSFSMLDVAPIKGDINATIKTETPLAFASTLLEKTINAGNFQVLMSVDTFNDPIILTAKPYSLQQIVHEAVTQEGYSSGIMAAVGIGTLIGGFLIGAIIIIIVVRARGSLPAINIPGRGSSGDNNMHIRFENEFENPSYDVNAQPIQNS